MDNRALIFCRTPLQALIANRLLERLTHEVVVVYYPINFSDKHCYYFEKIQAQEKFFIKWKPSRLSDTLTDTLAWWRIPRSIRQTAFTQLYISSIGSIPFSVFISRNPNANIFTFDDGSLNISFDIFYNWVHYEPIVRRLAKVLIGGCNNTDLINKTICHFTIFNSKYVVGLKCPIVELSLYNIDHQQTIKKNSISVRVIVGSWFLDEHIQRRHDEIILSNKFDLVLPHPGDRCHTVMMKSILHSIVEFNPSKMIAEDLILSLVAAGFAPIVYGFGSTVLFNLAQYVRTVSINLDQCFDTADSELMIDLNIRRMYCRSDGRKTTLSFLKQST